MSTTVSIHLEPGATVEAHDDRQGGYLAIRATGDVAELVYLFLGDPDQQRDQLHAAHRQLDALELACRVARANLLDRVGRREDDPTETDEPTDEPVCPVHGATCHPVWHRHDAASSLAVPFTLPDDTGAPVWHRQDAAAFSGTDPLLEAEHDAQLAAEAGMAQYQADGR